MEGASTVTIGGVALADSATNLSPFDVTGVRNDTLNLVAPRTLDGPIRITTEGGYAQIAGPVLRRRSRQRCSPASSPTPRPACRPIAATPRPTPARPSR